MSYRYDLQVHTDVSPCSQAAPGEIVEAATQTGLDGIVITDHDTMANVDSVRALAPADLDVIPGVEVSTTDGHLLAIDVDEPPPRSDVLRAIDHVHDQGGFAIPSHPFDTLREHYGDRLVHIADRIDGIEVVNSRCVRQSFNDRAAEFADRHGLASTGGSDAHFPFEVGRAYTKTERPLLEALERGETVGVGRGRYLSGHVLTKLHQYLP